MSLKNFLDAFREEAGIIMPTITVENGIVTYTKICDVDKIAYSVAITMRQYIDVQAGKLYLRDILVGFTPEQREFIQSGTTPSEWNNMFPEEEDEEYSEEELEQNQEREFERENEKSLRNESLDGYWNLKDFN